MRPERKAILPVLILLEVFIFSLIGANFFTTANFFEVLRISTELGLLALTLTCVIVTGGIDLSVGSLMGLSAVLLGKLWRDCGLPPYLAAALALTLGAAAGGLNGLLITRLRIPALIVTLGSYSLFRGLAEGLTGGVDNFTNFPRNFLFLGQEYIGHVPAQLPILLIATVAFWLLLHRAAVGRALSAIGFSPEGARHAAIPVQRRLMLVYTLSGLVAALAGVIFVARVGQAKSDAGTGYELSAITAVVLGGTSIFGGRGTIAGSLMGLFAIAILQNGLRLADGPPELAGILTGLLLLIAIGADWRPVRQHIPEQTNPEKLNMRNTQLAVLCGVILLAALIVTSGNFILVRSLVNTAGRTDPAAVGVRPIPTPAGKQLTIAMMPKSKGNAYFIAARKGADEAAKELGINLLWDGPTDPDPAKQNEIVETWITRGADVIAIAVENREGVSTALRKARQKGIKVVTYDSDAEPDARDFFVNQATPQGIGSALMDEAARILGNKGDFAVITGSLTAANQIEWRKYIELRRAEKYPQMRQVAMRPCDDLQNKAFDEATTMLNAYPNMKLIMSTTSLGVPGAAEAVKQSGRKDVKVIGLGLPNENKKYVHEGVTVSVILWKTMDLGYLTVHAAVALKNGTLKPGDTSFSAARLGKLEVRGDNILLGTPFTFNKDNIDQFDF